MSDQKDAYDDIKAEGQFCNVVVNAKSGNTKHPTLTPTLHPTVMATMPIKDKRSDENSISSTMTGFMLAAWGLPITVTSSHLVKDAAGVDHKIIELEPFAPAGTVIYYTGMMSV